MNRIISLNDAFLVDYPVFIDMRSPTEYDEGHIPGAVNIPLLNDEERAEVGTVYKRLGAEQAKQLGLEIVSAKLPDIVDKIRGYYKSGKTVIIYCWRGGMRSKSVVAMLEIMGIKSLQLVGGYKAYRQYVLNSFNTFELHPRIIVLCGSTGTGKTQLLKKLVKYGIPVIDLEGLANHRGSVFGHVGLGKPITAKNFDSVLLAKLAEYNNSKYIVVECESKRIGNVYVPDILFAAMKNGIKILLSAKLKTRITRLIEEYAGMNNDEALIACIKLLDKRLGVKKTMAVLENYRQGNVREVVKALLTDYYDPLYGYENTNTTDFDLIVDGEDLDAAAINIANYIRQLEEVYDAESR